MRSIFVLGLLLSFWGWSQNLIINPGAEFEPITSNGWTATCSGACNWIGSPPEKGSTHSGSGHFYAGDNSGSTVEIYQDVNVSAYASSIDAGTAVFTFSAWTAMYNAAGFCNNDPARIIVEARNASNTLISNYYDSNWRTNISWQQYAPAATSAPIGTRYIRVRLMSKKDCGTAADGYFDDLLLTTTAPLPVSLVSFEAETGENIVLKWATASETNNDFFTLEKATESMEWVVLGTVKGVGNSNQVQYYEFADRNPIDGVQYYRLKQTDKDGTVTSFEVISVSYTDNAVTLFPNPAEDFVTINTLYSGPSQVRFVNIFGQVVLEKEITSHWQFDIHNFSPGMYIVEVTNGSHRTLKRFQK